MKNDNLDSGKTDTPADTPKVPKSAYIAISMCHIAIYGVCIVIHNSYAAERLINFWPLEEDLKNFCATNKCVYDPTFVSSVYSMQLLFTLFIMMLVMVVVIFNRTITTKFIPAYLILAGIFIPTYWVMFDSHLSFSARELLVKNDMLANSVAWDPLGITRVLWISFLVNISSFVFLVGSKRKGS